MSEKKLSSLDKLKPVELKPKTQEQYEKVVKYLTSTEVSGIVKSVAIDYKQTPRRSIPNKHEDLHR